jgi:hypothetical protein
MNMNFIEILRLLSFFSVAIFSSVDVGIDIYLVYEYANNRYINETGFAQLIFPNEDKNEVPGASGYQWNLLKLTYTDPLCTMSFFFMIITGTWIALGGLCQTATIIHFLRKKDPLLSTIPVAVQILVCCTAPILMAPVVANIYGAYLVIKTSLIQRFSRPRK